MRNPILKGSGLIALGYLSVLGCGGGSDGGGGIGKGGSGGSAASIGKGGKGGSAGTIPIGGSSAGNNGGSANSGGSAGDACVADTRTGSRTTAALYFMVDISGSMNCPVPEEDPPCEVDPGNDPDPSRWTEASQAYKDFFDSSAAAGIWAGIAFFSGNSCDPGDYGVEVEIGELPGNAMALGNAVDNQNPGGNTPTVPSLTAAIDHARNWAQDHSDHQGVVVYATDGYPRGCSQNNTIDEAVNVAQDGFDGTPRVHTYVLAIGPNLSDLNRVAVAGGTNQAIAVNTSMDVGAQLIAALNQIRDEVVVDCAYTIPAPPAGRQLDYNQVNVSITTSDGDDVSVGKDDPSDSTCNGWEYSNDMTQIILCGDACDTVTGDPGASLNVIFDCQGTIIQPP